MKLWQIKAMSLRIMFADTNIQFSEEEFSSGVLLANGNTREKLIRMDDSIRRAIDRYYDVVGEARVFDTFSLDETGQYIDFADKLDFGYPERVDVKIYDSYNGVKTLRLTKTQVDYVYDSIRKRIYFEYEDYSGYGENVSFVVWYKRAKLNVPESVDQMTYDLNDIFIPEEVQRMIPYFVKGELYEEDEPAMAQTAYAMYINFLSGLKRPFNKVQTKVRRSQIFNKNN